MKTCSHCQSTAFDDMTICYGCLHPFDDAESLPATFSYPPVNSLEDEDVLVEEPKERDPSAQSISAPVRLHVAIPDLFGSDIYLKPGAILKIGEATIEVVEG